jgi:hypothetical protein
MFINRVMMKIHDTNKEKKERDMKKAEQRRAS